LTFQIYLEQYNTMQNYIKIHTNQIDHFSGSGGPGRYVVSPPLTPTTQKQPRNNRLDMFHGILYYSRIVKRESHVQANVNQILCRQGIQAKKLF
jgi:hypothetical protein